MRIQRAVPVMILALALGALASCGDTASLPTDPELAARTAAIHDGIPAPQVSPTVTGNDVLLTWTWSDTHNWDFVTFAIYEGGVRVIDGGKVRPYPAGTVYTASWTDYDVEVGSYLYCVKVMAKSAHAKRTPSMTYHSSACVNVDLT